ncbi:MAG: DUF2244 domain-containing protein [Parvibaculum sp.]|uniref:DUF2244 domain-containing protein n=1 Tax=Parvibaculum sp. TaxID=2024848 RepID=UPI002ABA821E|nr:DUF2244 domain-containing protein [Parvibaculum sp.]MDZ4380829.1 DUF2244 domain-containing protein [Parvibaculum sp.]
MTAAAASFPAASAERLAAPLHFDALLTPHRSLSRKGFLIVMGIIATVNLTAGAIFMAKGAWPVLGFCGLEVALVWWAFRANYRAARAHETVQMSQSELRVRQVDAKGRARAFSFQPYWVRLSLKVNPDKSTQLHLLSHGRALEVASFLSPPERKDFARALEAALASLKAARPD